MSFVAAIPAAGTSSSSTVTTSSDSDTLRHRQIPTDQPLMLIAPMFWAPPFYAETMTAYLHGR